jgi:hypothetical protein
VTASDLGSLAEFFGDLPDPRIDPGTGVDWTKKHKLLDIIMLAVCGVMFGADSWAEIEEYGQVKEAWLRQFLELPNGIQSHPQRRHC